MLQDTVKTIGTKEVMFQVKKNKIKNTKWISLHVVGEAPWPVDFIIYTGSEMHYR